MSDNLTVFGTDYTGVTGIKATGTGNGTLTYIRPTGTKSITTNGTGIDVTQYASVNVSVSGGGSSDMFIITLQYDSSTGQYTPNKTYSEIEGAIGDELRIIMVVDNDLEPPLVLASGQSYISYDQYLYTIHEWIDYDGYDALSENVYAISANGINLYSSDICLREDDVESMIEELTPLLLELAWDDDAGCWVPAVDDFSVISDAGINERAIFFDSRYTHNIFANFQYESMRNKLYYDVIQNYYDTPFTGTEIIDQFVIVDANGAELSSEKIYTVLPTFTVTASADWQTVTSVTCNRSFSDCYAACSNSYLRDKPALLVTIQTGTTYDACRYGMTLEYLASNSNSKRYLKGTAIVDGVPHYQIEWEEGSQPTFSIIPDSLVSLTVTQNGTYTPSNGTVYNSVAVTVPTGTARSSSDITVSGATVTVPAGLYSAQATKSVATGTAGTPTASAGTVTNHAVSVTPSVTNTAGYISGGTKTGTALTISAGDLVSGTLSITSSGTKDVTNYASATVEAGTTGTPTATKSSVSNHSVTVTPSVTNATGFITGGTKTGTAVTVTASELASGNLALSANTASTSCVGYSTVSVAVPFSTIHTSTSLPTSSQGANGDVWLKTVS